MYKVIFKSIIRNFNLLKLLSTIITSKKFNMLLSHYLQRYFFRKKVPSVIFLGITFRCQLECKYCGRTSYLSDLAELSTQELKNLIDQLAAVKIPRVHFSGGEPFLRNDLEDLVSYASGKGMITAVETNGLDIQALRLSNLKRSKLDFICVSLDGASENTHDNVTLKCGSFLQAIETIKSCRKERIPCIISTILRRELLASKEILKIFELAEDLGVSGIRLIAPRLMGMWSKKKQELLTIQEKKEAKHMLYLYSLPLLGKGPIERKCGAVSNYAAFISPYGEVQPCGYIPYSFGNIRSESFIVIMERMRNHQMLKRQTGCKLEDSDFRSKFINCVGSNADLPIKLY